MSLPQLPTGFQLTPQAMGLLLAMTSKASSSTPLHDHTTPATDLTSSEKTAAVSTMEFEQMRKEMQSLRQLVTDQSQQIKSLSTSLELERVEKKVSEERFNSRYTRIEAQIADFSTTLAKVSSQKESLDTLMCSLFSNLSTLISLKEDMNQLDAKLSQAFERQLNEKKAFEDSLEGISARMETTIQKIQQQSDEAKKQLEASLNPRFDQIETTLTTLSVSFQQVLSKETQLEDLLSPTSISKEEIDNQLQATKDAFVSEFKKIDHTISRVIRSIKTLAEGCKEARILDARSFEEKIQHLRTAFIETQQRMDGQEDSGTRRKKRKNQDNTTATSTIEEAIQLQESTYSQPQVTSTNHFPGLIRTMSNQEEQTAPNNDVDYFFSSSAYPYPYVI